MIEFFVAGVPRPQGSKRGFVNKHTNRVVVLEMSGKNLEQWRSDIHKAAQEHISERIDGPVSVEALFLFARPLSVSQKKRPHPTVAPDVDKLARALLDALTSVAFGNDAQVVDLQVKKRYCVAPVQPGVRVRIDEPTEFAAERLSTMHDGFVPRAAVRDRQEALAW